MIKLAHTFSNSTKQPVQDFFVSQQENCSLAIIAEGRDLVDSPSSYAFLAARTVKTVFEEIQEIPSLFRLMAMANESIAQLNKDLSVESNPQDWVAATAVCTYIKKDILFYSFIGNCGVAIFDNEGNLKFRTINDVSNIIIDKKSKDSGCTKFVKKLFSKPSEEKKFSELCHGLLTGKSAVEAFMNTGIIRLKKGDIIILYNNGFNKLIDLPDFGAQLLNIANFENWVHSHHDNSEKGIIVLSL